MAMPKLLTKNANNSYIAAISISEANNIGGGVIIGPMNLKFALAVSKIMISSYDAR